LTRFLQANRHPAPDQVRGHASLENALELEDVGASPRQFVQISQRSANRVAAAAMNFYKVWRAGRIDRLDRQIPADVADNFEPRSLQTMMLVEVHLPLLQPMIAEAK
jgi:hypothetical protein